MFHGTVLPTILRNFDRLSMAHGVEVRMPFMDWRLVTYTMALPEASKSSDGYTKMIARRAMARSDARVHPHGAPQGGVQFADAGMAEWSAFRLDGRLLDRNVPAFSELVDESWPAQNGRPPDDFEDLELGIGRTDLAVSEHEMDDGEVLPKPCACSKTAGFIRRIWLA